MKKMKRIEEIVLSIFSEIDKHNLIEFYNDAFSMVREMVRELGWREATKYSQKLRGKINKAIFDGHADTKELVLLSRKTLLFESPYLLDSYLQYLEINRPAKSKFYAPIFYYWI